MRVNSIGFSGYKIMGRLGFLETIETKRTTYKLKSNHRQCIDEYSECQCGIPRGRNKCNCDGACFRRSDCTFQTRCIRQRLIQVDIEISFRGDRSY